MRDATISAAQLEKAVGDLGTARNINTIRRLVTKFG
jgi:hypothetical protein